MKRMLSPRPLQAIVRHRVATVTASYPLLANSIRTPSNINNNPPEIDTRRPTTYPCFNRRPQVFA